MNTPTTERAREIITLYKEGKRDLFNWCDEYKQFYSDCVLYCVSSEWDYMLKKSMDGDKESPIDYEELDLFDIDRAKDHLIYMYDEKEEEFKEYSNNPDTYNRRVKTKGDFEVFLNSLSSDEIKQTFRDLDCDESEAEAEVYEWWLLSDPLKYRLEEMGEIFLNGAYGRQGTGQSLSMDSNIMKSYIQILEDFVRR